MVRNGGRFSLVSWSGALALAAFAVTGCAIDGDDGLDDLDSEVAALRAAERPRDPSSCSIVFEEETDIAASPETVWNLLVDLRSYGDWNPWIVYADGEAVEGAVVNADVVMGDRIMEVEHVVLAVEPTTRFCWRDGGLSSLFVYGQRCRWVEARPDGTVHFRQQLLLDGLFAQASRLIYGNAMRAGMASETAALRAIAERQ